LDSREISSKALLLDEISPNSKKKTYDIKKLEIMDSNFGGISRRI
jgi:hypothetical protein